MLGRLAFRLSRATDPHSNRGSAFLMPRMVADFWDKDLNYMGHAIGISSYHLVFVAVLSVFLLTNILVDGWSAPLRWSIANVSPAVST